MKGGLGPSVYMLIEALVPKTCSLVHAGLFCNCGGLMWSFRYYGGSDMDECIVLVVGYGRWGNNYAMVVDMGMVALVRSSPKLSYHHNVLVPHLLHWILQPYHSAVHLVVQ